MHGFGVQFFTVQQHSVRCSDFPRRGAEDPDCGDGQHGALLIVFSLVSTGSFCTSRHTFTLGEPDSRRVVLPRCYCELEGGAEATADLPVSAFCLQPWLLNVCATPGLEKRRAAVEAPLLAQIKWRSPGRRCRNAPWSTWWSSCSHIC